jgi:tol-pal system protein YbgF
LKALRLALISACLALGTGACVTTKSEGEEMRRDIAQLRADFDTLKADSATTREQLRAEQSKAVANLQAAMDALNRAARKTGADLGVELEKAQQDLTAVKGQLEVINHKLEEADKAAADRDKKIAEVFDWKSARQKQIDAAEHPTDKTAMYQLALKKLDAGDTARARELLTDFLSKFRDDPFAPNAQYWLGESYYAERRFNDAIVEFQKVIKDWKNSEKAADSLLKIGMSFQAQGDCHNAVLFFDEVVEKHRTNHSATKVAKEKLAECRKKRAGR